MAKAIPVILDTDIGTDIDDTWALAMLLRSPELDLRLVTSATDNTEYRARIIARLLEIAGRSDVDVGVGIRENDRVDGQGPWVADYDLRHYTGHVHDDGVKAIVDAIMHSRHTVTLLCIGPLPNIARALELEPRIAPRTRFVGMFGAVRKGYGGSAEIHAEYNVVDDIPSARRVFAASWKEIVITPLDTCGLVRLEGAAYQKVLACTDPLMRAVIGNYRIWSTKDGVVNPEFAVRSSVLFDTVAVHLAYSTDFLKMERLGIRVDDAGKTVEDPAAAKMDVATDWLDLAAYNGYLANRLTE